MPETFRDIYDNKSQLLHQVGNSHHFNVRMFTLTVLKRNIFHVTMRCEFRDIFVVCRIFSAV